MPNRENLPQGVYMKDSNNAEEHMLMDVDVMSRILELDDDSRWSFPPEAMSIAIKWVPAETIRITPVDDALPWPYELLNVEQDVCIRAKRAE